MSEAADNVRDVIEIARDAPIEQRSLALDDSQQAVLALPVEAGGVVFGAPGTGKTTTLVERVAWLLETGAVTPDEVMVVTPSRATATVLRDRLAVRIAIASNGALARSLGSLAFQIVRGRDVHRGSQPPKLLTAGEQDSIIADLLEGQQLDVEEGGADPWGAAVPPAARRVPAFRGELRAFMAECRERGLAGAQLRELGNTHGVAAWRAAGTFMEDYDRVRDQLRAGHYDASELVREAAAIVRDAAASGETGVLGAIAALRVVLVDDAQELTLAGVQLLTALSRRGMSVLAFGDPDVGAGAYQGASPDYLDRLGRAVGVERRVLGYAHRGNGELRALVRTVSERIGVTGTFHHRLAAPARIGVPGAVEVHAPATTTREADIIARRLRERHLLDGVPWSQMAVIAHDKRQVAGLERALASREVPTGTLGVARLLREDDAVSGILNYIRAGLAEEPVDAETITALLLGPLGGMDPVTMRRLRAALRREELVAGGDRPAAELLRVAFAERAGLVAIDTPEGRRAARLADGLRQVHRVAAEGGTVHELLWEAWSASKVGPQWRRQAAAGGVSGEEANQRLDALVALFAAAKLHVERQSFDPPAAFITRVLDSDVPDDTLAPAAIAERVTVMTPATALGTQFDTVVVAGLQDGVWPNLKARGTLFETDALAEALRDGGEAPGDAPAEAAHDRRAVMHDELRLLTRAISRADSRLIVTAVDGEDATPSVFVGLLTGGGSGAQVVRDDAAEHPLTLRGVVAQLRRSLTSPARRAGEGEAEGAESADATVDWLAQLAGEGIAGADPQSWYGVRPATDTAPLRDLATENVPVSPSRLETFRTCEVDWAVRELGGDTRNASTGVGTLIHSAMELTPGGDPEAMWAVVEDRWDELEFDAAWLSRRSKITARRMIERLDGYLRKFVAAGGTLLGSEREFRFEIPLVDVDGDVEPGQQSADEGSGQGGARAGHAVVHGFIDRVERLADGTVMIVDLKTGKNESRTNAGVAENLQLAGYQLAYLSAAIDGTEDTTLGGAQLLLVHNSTAASNSVATPAQDPLDAESAEGFTSLFGELARGMARSEFVARVEEHCTDPHSFGVCLIHTVKSVSAR